MFVQQHYERHHHPPVIAVDFPIWIEEIKSVTEYPVKSLMDRILAYQHVGAQLIIVFDGYRKCPKLRWTENSSSIATHSSSRSMGSGASSNSGSISYGALDQDGSLACSWKEIDEIKKLCTLFDVKYVQALGEAEAECSRLAFTGVADYVFSKDSDVLVFGARNIIRHPSKSTRISNQTNPSSSSSLSSSSSPLFTLPQKANSLPTAPIIGKASLNRTAFRTPYFPSSIPIPSPENAQNRYVYVTRIPKNDLNFSRNSLILFALLKGGDYDEGPRGIGTANAQALSFPENRFANRIIDIYIKNMNNRHTFNGFHEPSNRPQSGTLRGEALTGIERDKLKVIIKEILTEMETNRSHYFDRLPSRSIRDEGFKDFPNDRVVISYLYPCVNTANIISRNHVLKARDINLQNLWNHTATFLRWKPTKFVESVFPLLLTSIDSTQKLFSVKPKVYRPENSKYFKASKDCKSATVSGSFSNHAATFDLKKNKTKNMFYSGNINTSKPEYYYVSFICQDILKALNQSLDFSDQTIGETYHTSENKSDTPSVFDISSTTVRFLLGTHILKQLKFDYIGDYEKSIRKETGKKGKGKTKVFAETKATRTSTLNSFTNSRSSTRSVIFSDDEDDEDIFANLPDSNVVRTGSSSRDLAKPSSTNAELPRLLGKAESQPRKLASGKSRPSLTRVASQKQANPAFEDKIYPTKQNPSLGDNSWSDSLMVIEKNEFEQNSTSKATAMETMPIAETKSILGFLYEKNEYPEIIETKTASTKHTSLSSSNPNAQASATKSLQVGLKRKASTSSSFGNSQTPAKKARSAASIGRQQSNLELFFPVATKAQKQTSTLSTATISISNENDDPLSSSIYQRSVRSNISSVNPQEEKTSSVMPTNALAVKGSESNPIDIGDDTDTDMENDDTTKHTKLTKQDSCGFDDDAFDFSSLEKEYKSDLVKSGIVLPSQQ